MKRDDRTEEELLALGYRHYTAKLPNGEVIDVMAQSQSRAQVEMLRALRERDREMKDIRKKAERMENVIRKAEMEYDRKFWLKKHGGNAAPTLFDIGLE